MATFVAVALRMAEREMRQSAVEGAEELVNSPPPSHMPDAGQVQPPGYGEAIIAMLEHAASVAREQEGRARAVVDKVAQELQESEDRFRAMEARLNLLQAQLAVAHGALKSYFDSATGSFSRGDGTVPVAPSGNDVSAGFIGPTQPQSQPSAAKPAPLPTPVAATATHPSSPFKPPLPAPSPAPLPELAAPALQPPVRATFKSADFPASDFPASEFPAAGPPAAGPPAAGPPAPDRDRTTAGPATSAPLPSMPPPSGLPAPGPSETHWRDHAARLDRPPRFDDAADAPPRDQWPAPDSHDAAPPPQPAFERMASLDYPAGEHFTRVDRALAELDRDAHSLGIAAVGAALDVGLEDEGKRGKSRRARARKKAAAKRAARKEAVARGLGQPGPDPWLPPPSSHGYAGLPDPDGPFSRPDYPDRSFAGRSYPPGGYPPSTHSHAFEPHTRVPMPPAHLGPREGDHGMHLSDDFR